jgi:hypothetical protein
MNDLEKECQNPRVGVSESVSGFISKIVCGMYEGVNGPGTPGSKLYKHFSFISQHVCFCPSSSVISILPSVFFCHSLTTFLGVSASWLDSCALLHSPLVSNDWTFRAGGYMLPLSGTSWY